MSSNSLNRGLIYMALYSITQALVWGLVRYLGESMSMETLFFFRNLVGFLTIVPLLPGTGLALFRTRKLRLHLLRAVAAFVGGLSIFYAVAHAPLATVVAITFFSPVLASFLAIFLFGESLTRSRAAVIVTGFIGVLIVLRPSAGIEADGLLAAIVTALATAAAFLCVKKLSATESSKTTVAFPFLFILPLSAVLGATNWTPPSLAQLPLVLVMGCGISLTQFFLVKAFAAAEAGAVLPLDFLRLVVASIVGSLFFQEVVDVWVVAGSMLILGSSVYSSWKEQKSVPARVPN
ncbi:DMT family transporter [Emcibacter nanhaiensis]|uniref:DMT family transporter n=1 Tax=Emcibacter nanhaiensis TaxID=1505037 RepID=A0A501PTB2_9PROT|nr:DMT family transporter [Emcibacter nanhaiensis]TPD63204.1 DMT family transporter [Emcibacter nanhaiensis]